MEIFGIPLSAMLSQLLLGLVNGSFYAILSLGLAIIFGLLNVINFASRASSTSRAGATSGGRLVRRRASARHGSTGRGRSRTVR